jgi:cellobiose-specific phosphotransferase system component IIA
VEIDIDMEEIILSLLAKSGDARSSFMEAIRSARANDFEKTDVAYKEGCEKLLEAHKIHTGILNQEIRGEKISYNLLLNHAQDHMMNASLLNDISGEIIALNKRMHSIEIGRK